jgi:LuxR family transcriptional regulator, maltose regulon positive regulatory protein
MEPSARRSGAVLAATKLHIPTVRPGLVARRELVDGLVGGGARKLTLIGAPPGYGKTTLLAEWHSSPREERAFAWLSLDEGDNDPARFWTGVIDALRTVKRDFGEVALGALEARGIDLVDTALPLLVNELTDLPRGVVIVLDDYQFVREADVHRSVSFLLEHLPETLHVALATRVDPALPLARMRARGELKEIRARELRLSDHEAAELLRSAVGGELGAAAVAQLQERTEGWAAGLYLAALSLRGREDAREFIDTFAGDDRHVVDYLSAEVLEGQPAELRDFLLRTSVLDRLSGPLCDAVLGTERSDRVLEQIESENLFLVSLDTTRTWYRYHHLFGELLLHELELSEPGAVEDLHRRAADWYRAEGSVPEAIRHATAARDYDGARELIARNWNDFFNEGRLGTVSQWLDAIPEPMVNADPRLGVAAAWLALDRGRLEEARRSIQVASDASGPDAAVEGPDSVAADIEVLRAVHGFKVGELSKAITAASRVLEITSEETDSFPRTVAHLIAGVTRYWSSELEDAVSALDEAARLAREGGNDLGHSYALGYLGLIAADEGEIEEADRLGSAATGLSEAPGFVEHFVPMIGHLARGRAAKLGGRLDDAERAIVRAEELSRRGGGRLEIASSLVALAEVRQLQGDSEAAGALLDRARLVLDRCPEPGTLLGALEAAERGLRAARRDAATGPAREELTDRELAVLRLLDSSLSRREIADALYVTPNTVKTHIRGIYRKLDASTREEAVGRARESGLL